MVRAISDLLDNKDDNTGQFGSDDERQSLASTRAAAFAINLIINLNTKFLEDIRESSAFRYAVILKISANNIEGVHRATRLLADAINDPHLTVESLQPANSFVLRVSTSLHSAAYARAIFSGGFISDLIGTEVTALESDVVRTGEPIFDAFLEAIVRGNAEMILIAEARLLDAYPAWHGAALALERMVIGRKERPVEKLGVEGQDAAVDKEWRALIEEIQEISSRLKINRSVLAKVVGISKVSISRAMHSQVRPSAYMFNQMETLLQRLKDKERPLGRRVSEMRMRAGISQGELARQLAISPSTISKIERGHANPNHRTMQLLEKMLKEHGFSS
jgi:transcriptional regulator with XRE-family HTH domain